MDTEDALLAGIAAAPADDLPRLVYADWLDEHGDERCRFVRGHADLRRLGPDHPLRPAAEDELSGLRAGREAAWLAVIEPERADVSAAAAYRRRGCDCFDAGRDAAKTWHRLAPHAEAQDTACDAWKRLCDLVDTAARDGRREFAPFRELPLGDRQFIVTLPPTVARLKQVQVLHLYGSDLVRLPPQVGDMDALEVFIPYTSYRLHWFPYEITRCRRLRRSTVSTRALYGNRKLHPPFADLAPPAPAACPTLNSLARPPVRPCSVCGRPFEDHQRHRVWVTLRVATDDLPLLVNACSAACVGRLPPPQNGYCLYPHRGGLGTPRRYHP